MESASRLFGDGRLGCQALLADRLPGGRGLAARLPAGRLPRPATAAATNPVVRDQVGIAVWWGVLLGLAVGALPLRRLRSQRLGRPSARSPPTSPGWRSAPPGRAPSTAASPTSAGSPPTSASSPWRSACAGRRGARRMISAVGAGIVVLAAIGLLALAPAPGLVPGRPRNRQPPGQQPQSPLLSARLLERGRRRWSRSASRCVLYLACSARHLVTRALAAAALPGDGADPLLHLLPRRACVAAVVGLVVFVAFAHDRMLKVATMRSPAARLGDPDRRRPSARRARRRPVQPAGPPPGQRDAGDDDRRLRRRRPAAGAASAVYLRNGRPPAWTSPRGERSLVGSRRRRGGRRGRRRGLVASGKVAHAWSEFKESNGTGTGAGRLQSFSSNGRVPYWEAALHEFSAHPLVGGGSGSFEVWWAQHRGEKGGFVRDAHSLYLETLGRARHRRPGPAPLLLRLGALHRRPDLPPGLAGATHADGRGARRDRRLLLRRRLRLALGNAGAADRLPAARLGPGQRRGPRAAAADSGRAPRVGGCSRPWRRWSRSRSRSRPPASIQQSQAAVRSGDLADALGRGRRRRPGRAVRGAAPPAEGAGPGGSRAAPPRLGRGAPPRSAGTRGMALLGRPLAPAGEARQGHRRRSPPTERRRC